MIELTTVTDGEAIFFAGLECWGYEGLEAGRDYELHGVSFRTLPRPAGERLATVATVNDVHFGETECGVLEGFDIGPVISVDPGEPPYPETMSGAAIAEIAAAQPDAVVAKGDLTAHGSSDEYQLFRDAYASAFDGRLHEVRGNHDACGSATFAAEPWQEVVLPGVRLAVLDTARPGRAGGGLTADQLEWLDELGARSDRPVLVFGHHHVWDPASARPPRFFGIAPDDSQALVDVVARRPRLVGYFAGHTHRNRVRRFAATGHFPWAEVASVKDFPGVWAEYRVYEGGILQITHRISAPPALAWSERTRALFGGLYPTYALGALDDRCFAVTAPPES